MVARFQPRYELYVLIFPNKKRYFGISKNAKKRFIEHTYSGLRGSSNFPVHRAIRKYGHPILQILCVGRRDYIRELEVACINKFKTTDRRYGYNVSLGGESGPSPEMAIKISRTKLEANYTPPQEVRDQISASLREYFKDHPEPISPKHRAAINASLKTRKRPPPFSEEHRDNLRKAMRNRGTEHLRVPEVVAKAVATRVAKFDAKRAAGLPLISEKTRAKHRAYRPKKETIEKISVALREFNEANPGYFVGRPNSGKFISNDPAAAARRRENLCITLALKKRFFEETCLPYTQGLGFICPEHKQMFKSWRVLNA
jgi:hypothetical protein